MPIEIKIDKETVKAELIKKSCSHIAIKIDDRIELRQFSPIFKTLQKKLVQLKEEELNQHKNKISVEAYKNADMISTNLINRISGQAIKHIRQKAKTYSQTLGTLTDFFKD